ETRAKRARGERGPVRLGRTGRGERSPREFVRTSRTARSERRRGDAPRVRRGPDRKPLRTGRRPRRRRRGGRRVALRHSLLRHGPPLRPRALREADRCRPPGAPARGVRSRDQGRPPPRSRRVPARPRLRGDVALPPGLRLLLRRHPARARREPRAPRHGPRRRAPRARSRRPRRRCAPRRVPRAPAPPRRPRGARDRRRHEPLRAARPLRARGGRRLRAARGPLHPARPVGARRPPARVRRERRERDRGRRLQQRAPRRSVAARDLRLRARAAAARGACAPTGGGLRAARRRPEGRGAPLPARAPCRRVRADGGAHGGRDGAERASLRGADPARSVGRPPSRAAARRPGADARGGARAVTALRVALVGGPMYDPMYALLEGVDVEVAVHADHPALNRRVAELLSRGERLDLISTHAKYAPSQARWLRPLDDLVDPTLLRELAPRAVALCRFGGQLLCVPRNVDVRVLWVRADLVATPPDTWADVRASGRSFGFPGRESGLFGTFFEPVVGEGGRLFDDRGRPTIATAEAERAVGTLCALAATAPPDLVDWHYDQVDAALLDGRVAMAAAWPGAYGPIRRSARYAQLVPAAYPAGPRGRFTYAGAHAWAIPTTCGDVGRAVELLHRLAGAEAARRELANGGVPAHAATFASAEPVDAKDARRLELTRAAIEEQMITYP